jgi:uncharacterized YccA/Bax inhibitor family protein
MDESSPPPPKTGFIEPEYVPGQALIFTGVPLLIVGVIAVVVAWFYSTSLPVSTSYDPVLLEGKKVVNLSLLQNQMMIWNAGLAALVGGAALCGMGRLEAIIVRRSSTES